MYRIGNVEFIEDGFLDVFERFQETNRVYCLDSSGELREKEEIYIDDWDGEKKKQVIQILRYYLELNGAVVAVTQKGRLLGFAAINGKLMGSRKQYLNLGFIHVSRPARGNGIGRMLFSEACKSAIARGAEKLYIGANPAVDTYHFYKAMGCTLAQETIGEIYDHEPLDLQLEFDLTSNP